MTNKFTTPEPTKTPDELMRGLVKDWMKVANGRLVSDTWKGAKGSCADQLSEALEGNVMVDREDLDALIKSCDPYEFNIAMRDKYFPQSQAPKQGECKNPICLDGKITPYYKGRALGMIDCPDCKGIKK